MSDIESLIDTKTLNDKYEQVMYRQFDMPTECDIEKFGNIIQLLLSRKVTISEQELKTIKRDFKFNGKNTFLYELYRLMVKQQILKENESEYALIRNHLKLKRCKSHSGVLVITVFTSPYPEYYEPLLESNIVQPFSCAWNCAYCPNEPGQPRSYLKGEPGVLRANRNNYDCVKQMHDRMNTLYKMGHPIDKLEVIVLGGTWVSYPKSYREQFCRDIYYAANIFWDKEQRQRCSIEEEKELNENARTKVIGLTLETRPDTITTNELHLFRLYGCTRVQLGIQHLDEVILDKIDRKCSISQIINAIKLLKNCGFKVDSHWMPNLPGSSVEKDKYLFIDKLLGLKHPIPKRTHTFNKKYEIQEVSEVFSITEPDFQTDQWKIYPCAIVPWTKISKWYIEGLFTPYDENDLINVLIEMKTLIFPWIRLNRIVRDIPGDYIIHHNDKTNLRQELKLIMDNDGSLCQCIRCKEVKSTHVPSDNKFILMDRQYEASGGIEHFISVESIDNKIIYGFVRLRFCDPCIEVFPELLGCALIRELHVYGLLATSENQQNKSFKSNNQHKGIGKLLMSKAEETSKGKKYKRIVVIAGEGTRNYYRKLGYDALPGKGRFMIKLL